MSANSGLTTAVVRSFVFSGTNVFSGSGAGVYLSTNNGTSWSAVNSDLPYNYVRALALNGTNLFAAVYATGVFLSTNNGASWSAVDSGLTNSYVECFAVSGGNIFAGSRPGVFHSTNNGTSWVNVGLDLNTINSLAIMGTDLFAATNDGIWTRPLAEMVTSVQNFPSDLPTNFTLQQNYPNPFNPSTTISFDLPSKSFVSLKISDALGREVEVLVSEEMAPGIYSRQWNASGVSSGIYFFRLEAGSFVQTKKLILLR